MNVYLLVPGQTTSDVLPTFLGAAVGAAGATRLAPGEYDLVIENAQGVSLYGPDRIMVQGGVTEMLTITDTEGGGAPFVVSFDVNP
ncbi:MAG: hypothetical protein HC809_12445 [Gammaproteobacteria bacterium]|nr:hypothetical protein [Gammaproteobacteria bacterium]